MAGNSTILRDRRTRLIAVAGCALALPLCALAIMALAQTRYIAAALASRELATLQQSARLGARELLHVVSVDESRILVALDVETEEGLTNSLASAEEAEGDIICFALLADGRFLYPPDAAKDGAGYWLFQAARRQRSELLARLDEQGRARVPLSAREGSAAVSLFRLKVGGAQGVLGIGWTGARVEAWGEALALDVIPAGIVATLADADGHPLARFAGSGRSAPEPRPGSELAATIPLGSDAFSWHLTADLEDPAEISRLTRRHVWLYGSVLATLALVLAAGIWLLVAVALREIELTRIKADFAANVSHELRTPLALIRAAGEALTTRSGLQPAQTERYLGIIGRESRRLGDLINTVLSFSRFEQHGVPLDLQDLDAGALAREVAGDHRERLQADGFSLDLRVPDAPLPCRADAEALRLALSNLLDNAAKFSGAHREIALHVEPMGASVALRVQDRGIGIAPEDRDRIFESFYRGERDLVKRTRGTGIGLSLVDAVVRAHGGRVEVESEPGEGSTFSIVLPLAGSGAGQPAARA